MGGKKMMTKQEGAMNSKPVNHRAHSNTLASSKPKSVLVVHNQ